MTIREAARRFGTGAGGLYRRYAEWLVATSWKRFFLLSLLVLIVAGILSGLPPFNWNLTTRTVRVVRFQLNGGRPERMPATMRTRSDSRKKRFQLVATSHSA